MEQLTTQGNMAERVGCEDSDVFAWVAQTQLLSGQFSRWTGVNRGRLRTGIWPVRCHYRLLVPDELGPDCGRIVTRSKFLDFEDCDIAHLAVFQCSTFTIACGTIAGEIKAA